MTFICKILYIIFGMNVFERAQALKKKFPKARWDIPSRGWWDDILEGRNVPPEGGDEK